MVDKAVYFTFCLIGIIVYWWFSIYYRKCLKCWCYIRLRVANNPLPRMMRTKIEVEVTRAKFAYLNTSGLLPDFSPFWSTRLLSPQYPKTKTFFEDKLSGIGKVRDPCFCITNCRFVIKPDSILKILRIQSAWTMMPIDIQTIAVIPTSATRISIE